MKPLDQVAALVKGSQTNVVEKVQQLLADAKAQEKELLQLKAKLAAAAGAELVGQAQVLNGVKVLIAEMQNIDSKALRDTAEQLKNKLGSGIVVLAAREAGKASVVVAVSPDLTHKVKAGELVNKLAEHLGGGGGRPDLAMAGGTRVEGLEAALAAVQPILQASL